MRIARIITAILLAIAVLYVGPCVASSEERASCPLPPSYSGWTKKGYSQADFDKNNQLCLETSNAGAMINNSIDLIKRNTLLDQCLLSNGYIKQTAPLPLHAFVSDKLELQAAYCLGMRQAAFDYYSSLGAPQFQAETTKQSQKLVLYKVYFHEKRIALDPPSEIANYVMQGQQEFQATLTDKPAQNIMSLKCIVKCSAGGNGNTPNSDVRNKAMLQCMVDNDCVSYSNVAQKHMASCDEVDWQLPAPSYCQLNVQ